MGSGVPPARSPSADGLVIPRQRDPERRGRPAGGFVVRAEGRETGIEFADLVARAAAVDVGLQHGRRGLVRGGRRGDRLDGLGRRNVGIGGHGTLLAQPRRYVLIELAGHARRLLTVAREAASPCRAAASRSACDQSLSGFGPSSTAASASEANWRRHITNNTAAVETISTYPLTNQPK